MSNHRCDPKWKLKTILTLGPASSDEGTITSMLEVADKFRLNTSHLDVNSLYTWLKKLDAIFTKLQKQIPVVIDLQGSKMRIGEFSPVTNIPEKVTLFNGKFSESKQDIPVPHKILFSVVKPGDILFLNDAKIILKITKVIGDKIEADTLVNGPLSSNKGINRKEHPVPFNGLSNKDLSIIEVANKYSFTEFAFSFTHDGYEADFIRKYINNKLLIAKIERVEAVDNICSIDSKFDEIWFCRGDLGAQAGIFNLGKLQEKFVSKITDLKNRCFLAGQVLEHMTYFSEPTRSEIVHLYDTERNGFEGIVLSDETAVGENINSIVKFFENYSESSDL